ncbi:hypothetical protein FLCU109888_13300 [Flavobacterium cucumis]|uniref:Lipocalin-like domain-containing protein n=1 Tax=Flavobacterium cucumis TaxID=416016 RepID=A0A1M7ZY18_9FLAO|nr:hypothetical protein [Flavobacterium cucumis]SHO73748.1 hypothetical protein SAMN05443547_2120 [Flavobacterium cucumis]
MKKTFLILFGILTNIIFSQEIESVYKFKIEKQKGIFTHYELDSLALYKNGNFHQTYLYNYHQIKYKQMKGDWKIENGKLILDVKEETDYGNDIIWKKSFAEYRYKIKGKKLLPLATTITQKNGEKTIHYYFLPPQKLKLSTN